MFDLALLHIYNNVSYCSFLCLQCLRRLFEEKDGMHIFNGLKYLSTIIAVATRTINDFKPGRTQLITAAASSGVATIFNTYWDVVMDWGLLRRNSRNPWLRDKLILPNKGIYFLAMVNKTCLLYSIDY